MMNIKKERDSILNDAIKAAKNERDTKHYAELEALNIIVFKTKKHKEI